MSESILNEQEARSVFQAAINEGRAAEFMEALWNGGAGTIDRKTGKLFIITGDMLEQMAQKEEE